jgi:signal peptide peptidase SppA
MIEIVNRRISNDPFDQEEIRLRIEQAENGDREHTRVEVGGGVGIIPMYGPIFPKSNLMTDLSGATSLETFKNDFNQLLMDDKVKNIILDIDSPGGSSDMIQEMGDTIFAGRNEKPIYAVANTQANSAAYWLGAQANQFYATPSGRVGSIGVYAAHEDVSERDKAEGRKITFISAGELKTAGNPHEPLGEEARAYLQEMIDECYDSFVGAVAQGRGVNSEQAYEWADGRVFSATKAQQMGMIDGVKSLDGVVDTLLAEQHTPVIRSTLSGAMAKHHNNVIKLEHADMEHSEPGTGSPPDRREDNDIKENDPSYGSRREPPPIAYELEEEAMNDFLERLGAHLSVPRNDGEEDEAYSTRLLTSAASVSEELKPLREAEVAAHKTRAFRDQYPDEFERLQSLEATDRDTKAKSFAARYERFNKVEGEGDEATEVPTAFGFSARTLHAIEDAHKEMPIGAASHLKNVLDSIAANGVVDYSSRGSSRTEDDDVVAVDPKNPRAAFAAEVKKVMEQDGLDRKAAIEHVSKTSPELAEAYAASNAAESSR